MLHLTKLIQSGGLLGMLGLFGLLLGIAAPGFSAPIPTLQSTSAPDYVTLDGDLKEFQGRVQHQLLLGAAQQVAGTQKATGPKDFSAKVWLRMTKEGLWLAGQVKDDKVKFPKPTSAWLNADHIELWLAFPQAQMPVMGFANQFGLHEVAQEKACQGEDFQGAASECIAWFRKQSQRRQWLPNLFLRQFIIAPGQLQETWWSRIKGSENLDIPLPEQVCCDTNLSVFKAIPGGYQFEAFISSQYWPATQEWPVKNAKVLVDFVDNDTGTPHQEHFFSSSPQRQLGQRQTFNPLSISYKPETGNDEFPVEPSVTSELLQDNPLMFVFPAYPNQILGFMNLAMGYQFQPTEPSPSLIRHEISSKPLLIAGKNRAYLVPDKLSPFGYDQKLVSFQGTQKVAELKLQSRSQWGPPDYTVTHYSPSHAFLGLFAISTLSPYGSGACGACPYGEIETVAMDNRSGIFTPLAIKDTGEHASAMTWPLVWIEPDGSAFGFAYRYDDLDKDTRSEIKQLLNWKDLEALVEKNERGLGEKKESSKSL